MTIHCTMTLVMLLKAVLLSPCFPILLNVDMVIGLEGMDGFVGELNTVDKSAITLIWYVCLERT